MIGQTLDHYRIIAQIGEGGMGVVYRARDEVLERDVALKVLGRAADQLGHDHLLREAQTASSLSHPNICTIHQVGQIGDAFYVVMELIEGQPLSDMIGATGMPIDTVTRYGVQIADALAHAHERGVVHRDLKSANVMVTTEGRVKVLDFGLATRVRREAIDDLTRSYRALESEWAGTLPYMAPEILQGSKADEKSDLWALGVVLHEAVSGRLPFTGNTGFEVSSAILREAAPPLPARVPPGLAAVVQRCLAKQPAQRFHRASEVRAALETVQSAAIAGRGPTEEQRGPRTLVVLRGMEHLAVRNRDVLLLVGTNKGAFLLRSSRERARWDVAGPYFHGQNIFALAYDGRNGRHRIWASTNSILWGTLLRWTDDFGRTWTNPLEASIKFPAESGASLSNIWQICADVPGDPDAMYCGVEPAALFESRDEGLSWSLVRGLFDHPHRPRWVPGNGGLCLHTIVPDPSNKDRIHVAISAAGVYRTDDAGRSWTARNAGVRVVFMPEKYPEFGQCVHKIVMHRDRPERLFLQNHWGLYRSDNAGDSWQDVANGVPSDFGFAMVMHPHDADCVYIVPVESDEFRCTPDGRLRVYRTRNAGRSWEPLTRGLPQNGAYETVLRDAMSADSLDPAGIYFGTRSGKLFASKDEGRSWKKVLDGLPQIVCVKSVVVAMDGAVAARARAVPKAARSTARSKSIKSRRKNK